MDVCRACLSNDEDLLDIFAHRPLPDYDGNLADMLNEIVDSKIKQNDELPRRMCRTCILNAQIGFRLKQKFEHSHKLLMGTIRDEDYILGDVVADNLLDNITVKQEKHDSDLELNNSSQWQETKLKLEPEQEHDLPSTSNYLRSRLKEHKFPSKKTEIDNSDSSSEWQGEMPIKIEVNVETDQLDHMESTSSEDFHARLSPSNIDLSKIMPYQCKHCSEGFSLKTDLRAHSCVHSGEKRYKCPQCPKTFTRTNTRATHMRTHTGERPFKCPHCPKDFKSRAHLKNHVYTHTGGQPFKCAHCPRAFTNTSDLKNHTNTHTGERPYQCTYCLKSYPRSDTLTAHIRIHTGERPYKCSYCPRAFMSSSHLKSHTYTHTGAHPCKCPHCPKAFLNNSDLKSHVYTHTGERPYKCAICEKTFTRSDSLTAHKRTHTGERPYKCTQCPRCFTTSSHLKSHTATHANKAISKSDSSDAGSEAAEQIT